jgi:hypothetical protein
MDKVVRIYDEEGKTCDTLYTVIGEMAIKKNIIKLEDEDGVVRLIHKDRIIEPDSEPTDINRRNSVMSEEEKKPKAKAKKKKPMVKFDLENVQGLGVVFRKSETKTMETKVSNIKVESYCIVSEDGRKWKHFNLYDGSLGKKGRPPAREDFVEIKHELSGNMEAIQKYLEKKKYTKHDD